MIQDIENIELKFLTLDDYQELKETMILSYSTMPNAYWKEHQIKTLIEYFPEGQIVVKVNSQIAGVALSIIVDYQQYEESHTYKDITGNFTFNTHDNEGEDRKSVV